MTDFPLLVVLGGIVTSIWDVWLSRAIGKLRARRARRVRESNGTGVVETHPGDDIELTQPAPKKTVDLQHRSNAAAGPASMPLPITSPEPAQAATSNTVIQTDSNPISTDMSSHGIPVSIGVCIIVVFFGLF